MASWLDGLSTALTAGTKGASGWLEGQQRGRKEAEDRAKEMAAMLRQKAIDEQNALLQNAQIAKLNKPEAPPEVSRGAAIFQDGKWIVPSPYEAPERNEQIVSGVEGTFALRDGELYEVGTGKPYSGKVTPAAAVPPITYLQGMGATGPEFFAAPTRPGGAPKPTGVGVIPRAGVGRGVAAGVKLQSTLREAGAAERNVQNAIDQVVANPNAFGLKNLLPKKVRERLPGRDNAVDATSIGSLEYVVGDLRQGRYGSALTATELRKAEDIFSNPSSPPEVIIAQLKVLQEAAKRNREEIKQQVESMGLSGEDMASDSPSASKAARTVSRSDYNALVLANGKAAADALLKASNARVVP